MAWRKALWIHFGSSNCSAVGRSGWVKRSWPRRRAAAAGSGAAAAAAADAVDAAAAAAVISVAACLCQLVVVVRISLCLQRVRLSAVRCLRERLRSKLSGAAVSLWSAGGDR
jgi:hypothetical protein